MVIEKKNKQSIFKFSVKYASQDPDFKEVPIGYINKTVCGCGLTTVAIQQPYDTIIAVPNVALVDNKVKQYMNDEKIHLLGVKEGVGAEDIRAYVEKVKSEKKYIKIITTYDSLKKCDKWLCDCRFVIDECQMLAEYSVLKCKNTKLGEKDCITYLMETAMQNKERVSFISATPLPAEVMKPYDAWLTQLPQIRMEWPEEPTPKTLTLIHSKFPCESAIELVINPLKNNQRATVGNNTFSKAIIFINSVKAIENIIEQANLKTEETVILCSDTLENSFKLRGYERLTDYSNLPRFTFITSTGFQGIDLYDPEAITVVISTAIDVDTAFKMIDVDIDLQQCLSRQRLEENPHHNSGILFYSTSDFKNMSADHFIHKTDEMLFQKKDNCSLLNDEWDKRENQNPPVLYNEWADLYPRTRFTSLLNAFSESTQFANYCYYDSVTDHFTINEFPFKVTTWLIANKMKLFDGNTSLTDVLEDQGYQVEEILDTYVQPNWKTIRHKFLDIFKNHKEDVTFCPAELRSDYYFVAMQNIIQYNNEIPKTYKEAQARVCSPENWQEMVRTSRNLLRIGETYNKEELDVIFSRLFKNIQHKSINLSSSLAELGFETKRVGHKHDRIKIVNAKDVDMEGHLIPDTRNKRAFVLMCISTPNHIDQEKGKQAVSRGERKTNLFYRLKVLKPLAKIVQLLFDK